MKSVYLLLGRDCTDEIHFDFVEDVSVFEYIIMNSDAVNERLITARELGHVVHKFTQTRCRENILEGYNVKDVYCYLVG